MSGFAGAFADGARTAGVKRKRDDGGAGGAAALEALYSQCAAVLLPCRAVWGEEVIDVWRRGGALEGDDHGLPAEWVAPLLARTEAEINAAFCEAGGGGGGGARRGLPNSLLAHLAAAYAADAAVPYAAAADAAGLAALPPAAAQGLKPKKRHEVFALAPLLARGVDAASGPSARLVWVDVGGGKGHLVDITMRAQPRAATCFVVDKDTALEGQGRRVRARRDHAQGRYPHRQGEGRPDEADVRYLNMFLQARQEGGDAEHAPLYDAVAAGCHCVEGEGPPPHVLVTGLHACGPLSNHVLDHAVALRADSAVCFGCCYQRLALDETREAAAFTAAHLNISAYARSAADRIPYTYHTPCLATKGLHTAEDMAHYLATKRYVYTLHRLLAARGVEEAVLRRGFGNYPVQSMAFAAYARAVAGRLGVGGALAGEGDAALERFFTDAAASRAVRVMLLRDRVRESCRRAVELSILADRALWALGQGGGQYAARLVQVFDRQVSPRNVAIVLERMARPSPEPDARESGKLDP